MVQVRRVEPPDQLARREVERKHVARHDASPAARGRRAVVELVPSFPPLPRGAAHDFDAASRVEERIVVRRGARGRIVELREEVSKSAGKLASRQTRRVSTQVSRWVGGK